MVGGKHASPGHSNQEAITDEQIKKSKKQQTPLSFSTRYDQSVFCLGVKSFVFLFSTVAVWPVATVGWSIGSAVLSRECAVEGQVASFWCWCGRH